MTRCSATTATMTGRGWGKREPLVVLVSYVQYIGSAATQTFTPCVVTISTYHILGALVILTGFLGK